MDQKKRATGTVVARGSRLPVWKSLERTTRRVPFVSLVPAVSMHAHPVHAHSHPVMDHILKLGLLVRSEGLVESGHGLGMRRNLLRDRKSTRLNSSHSQIS